MESQWNLLREVKETKTNDNSIEALAEAPDDSPWFSGHFPGEPILPGIALVNIVEQAIIKDALKKGDKLRVRALKRVRFSEPVRPGDTLSVKINNEERGEDILFSFKVIKRESVVCSGMITAEKIK